MWALKLEDLQESTTLFYKYIIEPRLLVSLHVYVHVICSIFCVVSCLLVFSICRTHICALHITFVTRRILKYSCIHSYTNTLLSMITAAGQADDTSGVRITYTPQPQHFAAGVTILLRTKSHIRAHAKSTYMY